MQVKVRERAIRLVFKDSTSDYDTLLIKRGVDPFRISSLKALAVEMYIFLNGIHREYLVLFYKSSPNCLRDDNKWMQQKVRTTVLQ